MKYYAVFATVTRRHAADLAAELNRATGSFNAARVARPERGKLKAPLRYVVIWPGCVDMEHFARIVNEVNAAVRPPRHPRFQLAREWCVDALISVIEALTRAVRALKSILKGKHHAE